MITIKSGKYSADDLDVLCAAMTKAFDYIREHAGCTSIANCEDCRYRQLCMDTSITCQHLAKRAADVQRDEEMKAQKIT